MESNRFKATVVLSSDHAGISAELGRLEAQLIKVFAHARDARQARDFTRWLVTQSEDFCADQQINMRGWMDNGRYRKA